MIFIHGAGMDSTVWAGQARYFAARGFRVLAPDLPGHGRSTEAGLDTIDEMASWLYEELCEFDVEQATIIGHSMGALVAIELGAKRSRDPIILLGVAAAMPVHPALLSAAENNLPAAAAMIADWGLVQGSSRRSQPQPGTSLGWGSRRLIEASRPGVLARDLTACAAYDQALERVAERQVALNIICGKADRMAPVAGARKLADIGGDSGFHVVENCGHMMLMERPAEVRRLIADAVSMRGP